jgi:exopolysaccharide production protein ExoZ
MTVPALPAAWTLCFEMLFYAAATLILIDRRLLIPILIIFGICMAARSSSPIVQFLGNPLNLEFVLGVALAFAPRWRGAIWLIPVGASALVAAGFFAIAPMGGTMEFMIGSENFQRVLVYGVPAALIVYGTMQINSKPSVWTFLGDASYSLYLTHTLPISLLLVFWSRYPIAPPDVITAVGVIVSVLFAWRIYVRFELPLLKALGRVKAADGAPAKPEPSTAGRLPSTATP